MPILPSNSGISPTTTRVQLFKINDVVSKRFVKISNVNISNMPIFLLKKFEKLLQCKSFSQLFNKNIFRNRFVKDLTS